MRRVFIFVLLPLVLLSSCTKSEATTEGFTVVAADFPSYDAARAILGGTGNLEMLLPPGTESHSYDPTPRDMVHIAECDLVIYTGGPSDEWVRTILSSLDNPPSSFALTDQVELLYEEHREGMEEEEGHHHSEHEIEIIRNLTALMASIDVQNAEIYENNAEKYINRIQNLDQAFRSIVSNSKRNTLIFASRFPLLYFIREYGLEYYAAFPGCAEESEPNARTVAFLIDKAEELEVPCILTIEMSSPMIANVIAEEVGCEVRVFNTLHNVSAADFLSGKDYVDLMEENIDVLKEALN